MSTPLLLSARRHRPTRLSTVSQDGWFIVIQPLPLHLGYAVRLERGIYFRGPALHSFLHLPQGISWWWRPTRRAAETKGYLEAWAS